jgi:hypothetical protein
MARRGESRPDPACFANRWDRLIETLEAHGVRATPTELDAQERTFELDMGHLG